MTQGRLYKSARAAGPMADDAILALPEREKSPTAEAPVEWHVPVAFNESETPEAPAATPAPAPRQIPSSTATPLAAAQPVKTELSDYDHIFASPDLTIADAEEDLFPWETPANASASAPSAMAGAAPAVNAPATPDINRTSAPQPNRVQVDGPHGHVEGTNTPVSTYLAKSPRIRLTFAGAAAAIVMVTVGLGFVEALMTDHIGLVTAVLSVATALAATWLVSDRDRTAPVLLLPIAWFVCAVIPGQFTAPPSGSLALKQIVVVLGVLGDNAMWIIAGTLACYLLARLRTRLVRDPLL